MDENILSGGFIWDALRPETVGINVRPANATVQVLRIKKLSSTIGGAVRVRHRLLISDGENTTPWVLIAEALNSLVEEKLMEVFAVLRINEIVCHVVDNRKILFLLSVEISIPGDFLRVKLGNPISCDNAALVDPVLEIRIDETRLTSGFIASVMRGEPLPLHPVVQILGIHKKLFAPAAERFFLFISDGEHSHSTYAVLHPILNFLIQENRLQVFTVIKITKLSIMKGQNMKAVAIESLKVLREGHIVGRKLGNPVPSHHAESVNSTAITRLQLTSGFIAKAMRSDSKILPPNPLLQILGSETIGGNKYKLVISDGDHAHAFAVLAQPLSDSIHKKLHDFTVIQVTKLTCNLFNNERILTIISLVIVSPGKCVGRKLGNPISWTNIIPLNIDEIKLTRGYIADLIRGEKLLSTLNPLIQILNINKVHCPTQNRDTHQLVISDGKHSYHKVTFGPDINDSFKPDTIDRFTVIRVKSMDQSAPNPFDTVTLILRAGEIVVDGKTVGRVLGNSKPWDDDHADGILTAAFTGTDLDPECPSCLTFFRNPVYQCTNGHLICQSCEPRCSNCPICRKRMPTKKIRSVAFEKILTSLTKMM